MVGGAVFTSGSKGQAAYWHDGIVEQINIPNAVSSSAYDINDKNDIVGYFTKADNSTHAFVLRNGNLTTDSINDRAVAINNAGQIAGDVSTSGKFDDTRVVLVTPGKPSVTFGTLGGKTATTASAAGDAHPFITSGNQLVDLGTLGGASGGANEINAAGQVVGTAKNSSGKDRAFLWQNGTMTDLNTLLPANSGWELTAAFGINTSGAIVGTGTLNGESHAFLLQPAATPTPSPSTSPTPSPSTGPAPSAAPLPAGSPQECFQETKKCMRSLFADYWHAHGGLAINGFPISDEFVQVLPDGKAYTVQYFERVRMEYHPETTNLAYIVQLGQFGRTLHPADPPASKQSNMAYFDVTGHNVPADFMDYWNGHGGLDQFGFPISEVITETLEDGKPYQVQYFERARFERHPENAAPYDILLGQFGRKILKTVMP
jgi:probable HAF family extracellular repeat protein